MQYITVKNGASTGSPHIAPKTLTLENGNVISGFDKLSDAEKITYGEYPFIDETPQLDRRYQMLGGKSVVINPTNVTVGYAIALKPIADFIEATINSVYKEAQARLDKQSEGRSMIEVAKWNQLKLEVAQYDIDETIGLTMNEAISTSEYDAVGISSYVNAKKAYEDGILAARLGHVMALKGMTTHEQVASHVVGRVSGEVDIDGNPIDQTGMIVWPAVI